MKLTDWKVGDEFFALSIGGAPVTLNIVKNTISRSPGFMDEIEVDELYIEDGYFLEDSIMCHFEHSDLAFVWAVWKGQKLE